MTPRPEAVPGGGPERLDLIKKIREIWNFVMGKKIYEEKAREAARKYKREQEEHESAAKRREEEDRQKQRDLEWEYHNVRSAQVAELEAEMSRNVRANEVNDKLGKVIAPDSKLIPIGGAYLIDAIRADANVETALRNLISRSSAAREAINSFLTRGREIHGNARQLVNLSQNLVYEAQKTGDYANLRPLLMKISQRAVDLLKDEFVNVNNIAHSSGQSSYRNLAEYLRDEKGVLIHGEEGNLDIDLVDRAGTINSENWRKGEEAVVRLITEPRPVLEAGLEERRSWVEESGGPPTEGVAGTVVSNIEAIWSQMQQKEETGEMTVRDLVTFSEKIREEESHYIPQDLPPGSEGYNRAVQKMNKYTDEKYKELVKRLKIRQEREKPELRGGITDPDIFLKELALAKGRGLGHLFKANPHMYELLIGLTPESRRFRDRVFLGIHAAVLTDQRNESQRNFGLYEMADFSTYLDLLRIELGKYTVKTTGISLGETLIDHYNILSNTIRQCRDIDHWTYQPGATFQNLHRNMALFQNEYLKVAFNIPAVNTAFRAYETVLRSIMTSNDGFIPPGLIEYSDTHGVSYWDNQARALTQQTIKQGSVPDIQRDEKIYGLPIIDPDGHSLVLDYTNPLKLEDVSREELKMYMTLAKGMGMVTARYLEMFGQARVPGSDHPELGMNRFHSTPYEGVAQSLNYFNVFVNKWRIGSYKFFYLFNQIVPDKNQRFNNLHQNDRLPGIRAFMDYQDGTFEDKYGPDAKRFIDLLNFTNISSAIGKDTLWRQYDSTYKWSDVEREKLGGATLLALIAHDKYIPEILKEIMVEMEYKARYREELSRADPNLRLPTSGAKFDALWEEYGRQKYS